MQVHTYTYGLIHLLLDHIMK